MSRWDNAHAHACAHGRAGEQALTGAGAGAGAGVSAAGEDACLHACGSVRSASRVGLSDSRVGWRPPVRHISMHPEMARRLQSAMHTCDADEHTGEHAGACASVSAPCQLPPGLAVPATALPSTVLLPSDDGTAPTASPGSLGSAPGTPRTVQGPRQRSLGGDALGSRRQYDRARDGTACGSSSSGDSDSEVGVRRSRAQRERARGWRVLGRWTTLGLMMCHRARQLQCVVECTSVVRHLVLMRGVPTSCPVLRACRAVRLIQVAWRLVPYHRDAASVRSAMLMQRVARRLRLCWVRRVALCVADPMLLSLRMRLASTMAPMLMAAAAARTARVAARVARVEAALACRPRTMERWRVGIHSSRLIYHDTVTQASQWTHPLTNSSAWPLVAVADAVAARRMWPPVGSPWEVAVATAGGICYRHADTDEVRWAPPPGSQAASAGPVYPCPAGLPDASCFPPQCAHSQRPGLPPAHASVTMLASPTAEGEREPRWLGQWDAVACTHVFVHRLTHAVRRGVWVSMPSPEGRIYYLNLRTAWSRWDPPPLWEAGWVHRAAQVPAAVVARGRVPMVRVPMAVPHGREVCGGAPVGVDVAAALQPCVAQVMAVVLGPEPQAGSHGAVLDRVYHPVPNHSEVIAGRHQSNPCFAQHLSGLRACLDALAAAVSLRFAVPSRAVASALWQLCPAWASVDSGYLSRCLAGPHGSHVEQQAQQLVLDQVKVAADGLRDGLSSADALTQALLPVLIAAGSGFHACLA